MLNEENENLNRQSLSAQEKEALETQLATAISEAFFNLNEKIKIEQELKEAIAQDDAANEEIKKLKEATNQANAVEEEVLVSKNNLWDKHKKFKELEK